MLQGTTVEVNGKRYQVIGDASKAMVSSWSHVNGWHIVRDGQCDCRGFAYRGRCSHVEAIAVATRPAKPAPKPAAVVEAAPKPAQRPLRTLMDLYDD